MKTSTKDYYAILGVTRDATLIQVKRAYRKLAKQFHPDVNNAPDAAERFRELTEAYDTLTDPARRASYDRLNSTAGTGKPGGEQHRSPGDSQDRAKPGPG